MPLAGGEVCNKIAETVALNRHVAAQTLSRCVCIAGKNGLHDFPMLAERGLHAVAHPELETTIRAKAAMQRDALLLQEAAVARRVDRLMKALVFVVVAVGVFARSCLLALLVGGEKGSAVFPGMPACGKRPRHGFQFGHHLEHFKDALRPRINHDGTPPRPDFDEPDRTQLQQGFPDRSTGNSEAGRKLGFVKALSRRELAGHDAVLDAVAQLVEDILAHSLPISPQICAVSFLVYKIVDIVRKIASFLYHRREGRNTREEEMSIFLRTLMASAVVAVGSLAVTSADAQTVLKASHQFPGGKGDIRDEMVQLIAKDVAAANVGLEIQVFPGSSLYKANDQWNAVTRGLLDMTSFPLDYASGRHPEFSATLMPGLVGNFDRAMRLNDSEFMQDIKKIIEDAGAIVISDAWLSGAFASKKSCITSPDTIKGQVIRAAGPAFEEMLVEAGASIASMPSSEIYSGMQTGVLDAANTSSASFVSYRLFEQAKCLTAPGENALWFMYEPVLVSKRVFEGLTEEQQKAILAAGEKAEAYFNEEVRKGDQVMIDTYKKAGVEVVQMSKDDFDAWLEVAKKSSYKNFAANVPGGDKLIEKALAVK